MFSLLFILNNPNCSYLSNYSVTPNTSIWGNEKQIAALKQSYQDRMRNYNELDNSFENQQSYYQNFSGRSQSFQDLYSAFRKTQTTPYVNNIRHARYTGVISPYYTYTGAVVAGVTGNPTKTNIREVNLEQQLNVTNQTASFGAEDGAAKVKVEMNATSSRDAGTAYVNNTEFYKIETSSRLFFGSSGTFTYGGTSGVAQASLSRPIVKNVVGVVDKSWCATGVAPTQVSGKLGYQVNF